MLSRALVHSLALPLALLQSLHCRFAPVTLITTSV
jgi:hypothetical protein